MLARVAGDVVLDHALEDIACEGDGAGFAHVAVVVGPTLAVGDSGVVGVVQMNAAPRIADLAVQHLAVVGVQEEDTGPGEIPDDESIDDQSHASIQTSAGLTGSGGDTIFQDAGIDHVVRHAQVVAGMNVEQSVFSVMVEGSRLQLDGRD